MKISELIEKLEGVRLLYGDVPVMVTDPDYGDFRIASSVMPARLFAVNEEHTRFDNCGKPKSDYFNTVAIR